MTITYSPKITIDLLNNELFNKIKEELEPYVTVLEGLTKSEITGVNIYLMKHTTTNYNMSCPIWLINNKSIINKFLKDNYIKGSKIIFRDYDTNELNNDSCKVIKIINEKPAGRN